MGNAPDVFADADFGTIDRRRPPRNSGGTNQYAFGARPKARAFLSYALRTAFALALFYAISLGDFPQLLPAPL